MVPLALHPNNFPILRNWGISYALLLDNVIPSASIHPVAVNRRPPVSSTSGKQHSTPPRSQGQIPAPDRRREAFQMRLQWY